MQVIIVGGGIAGLSAALSLHQIGVACRVYESVPRLAPIGHGINLQPNAVRELTALGLGDKLASVGILTAELAFYNNIWSQAASQGITSFVSSGDSGAAGCNAGSDTTGSEWFIE